MFSFYWVQRLHVDIAGIVLNHWVREYVIFFWIYSSAVTGTRTAAGGSECRRPLDESHREYGFIRHAEAS